MTSRRLIQPATAHARAVILAVALAVPFAVSAEVAEMCPGEPLPPRLPAPDREGAEVVVDARTADLSREDTSMLSGAVILKRADQLLETDHLTLRHADDTVSAQGNVVYQDRDIRLEADEADMDLAADRAELSEVTYALRLGVGRGQADAARLEGESRSWLSQVTFTTCPQGNQDWQISAREMRLDHDAGKGEARGLGLRFKGVPILYLPWASFPLDDRRKSGFLVPGIGSSDDDGIDLSIPYYWNIAPNQDATLTPRYIGDRGFMFEGEYRYLTRTQRGELDVQYMDDDDRLDAHRAYATLRHTGRVGQRWVADIDLRHVSDPQFFEDFGNSLQASSISFLRSRAELYTHGEWWRGGLMLDAYETVDREISSSREPYDRLPRFYFLGTRALGGSNWHFRLGAEAVDFDRDLGEQGTRVDVFPELSYPIYRPAGYLLPTLGVRYTAYDLDRSAQDSPSRTTAVASLEGGLVFERNLADGRIQTLEPRAHYLYVPFERQDELPEFDTTDLSFSFNQLFRSNRFTGADRQADANQLSLALTTRITDAASGYSTFDASLGTIVYFRDQKVQLSGVPLQDADTSPIVGELNWRPSPFWRLTAGFQWDPEDDEFDQGLLDIRYRSDEGRIFNIAYRRRTETIEQVDLSFLWPLNEQWSLVGRYNYSLRDDTDLETLLGFEYDSCCWALRLMGRRYVRNQDGIKRDGLYLELELKGLGSLGRSTDRVLQRAILGYQAKDDRTRY